MSTLERCTSVTWVRGEPFGLARTTGPLRAPESEEDEDEACLLCLDADTTITP
jgi:hypothetical protein